MYLYKAGRRAVCRRGAQVITSTPDVVRTSTGKYPTSAAGAEACVSGGPGPRQSPIASCQLRYGGDRAKGRQVGAKSSRGLI